jgi:capsular exopolysaccharide family
MNNDELKTMPNVEVADFSLKEFVEACLSKWWWFLVSLVVVMGIAMLYIKTREPQFERSEQVLVKDQDGSASGMGDIAGAFSSFGLGTGNANVNNELISLTSPAIMHEVSKRLGLYMNYQKPGTFHKVTLYGTSLPVNVDFVDIGIQDEAEMCLVLHPDGSSTLRKLRKPTPNGVIKYDYEVVMPKDAVKVKTPLGVVTVAANPRYTGGPVDEDLEIYVNKVSMQASVEMFERKLSGDLVDPDAEVIDLTMKDVNVERAVDVLNMILTVYTENWINDKNKLAVATSAFIDERLKVIQKELGDVDSNIAKYQTSTGTSSLSVTANLSLHKEAEMDSRIVSLENQLGMTRYMLEYLENPANKYSVAPLNIGVGSTEIENHVAQYNTLLLTRNNLVSNSSVKNPLVADYDVQLGGMRESLIQSVSAQIDNLEKLVKSARIERGKAQGEMLSTPGKVLPLLSEERQQKVKESLYLFLLQKREENELGQKFTADNLRIISPPMGSLNPVSPKKMMILAIAFVFAMVVPMVILYLVKTGDTKVRGRKDLESVSMPLAGEIPQVGKRGNLKTNANKKRGKLKDEKAPLAVVEEGKRDVVNEAFRVIRSNMDFISGKKQGCRVVMFTSFNPGSGKSFISYNLALSFALKQKRVLLIDCDLRHGSASMYVGMPHKGITDYLMENTDNWESLVMKSPANANLSILPVGKMPPNPAELLEGDRLKDLIEGARKEYDYVFLDCPPVNIVVDTQIVAPYADSTMFVVRAGLLERSALRELNEIYEEKRFNHIALILNGTDTAHSRYYTYGNYQSFAE